MTAIIGALFLLLAATLFGQLPPEVEADLNLRKAEVAARDGDAATAREAMERVLVLQEEHGLQPAAEDHYRYAQAWEAAGEPERAMEAAVRYLQLRGRQAEYYTAALDLINRINADATELVEGRPTDGVEGSGSSIGSAGTQTGGQDLTCGQWSTSNYFGKAAIADVRACLEAGADAMKRDAEGFTPLHRAAESSEHPEVIEALVAAGADPRARNQSGRTPLQRATEQGEHPDVIEALVTAVARLEARRIPGGPASCKNWGTWQFFENKTSLARAKKLVACLDSGADPMVRDEKGRTPMHLAANNSRYRMVEELLTAGADIGARDNDGLTALHYAMNNLPGQRNLVKVLLAAGADPTARDKDGWTPLHIAAAVNYEGDRMNNTIKALLASGADPSARDDSGRTPLHVAAAEVYSEALRTATKALLVAGADLEARDKHGRTSLHYAAGKGVDPKTLLAFGPDLEARDEEGRTPLHLAALFQFKSNVKELLAAGADPSARDNSGRTPLEVARAFNKKNPGVAKVLASAPTMSSKERGDGRGLGALVAGVTAATVGAASGLDTEEALEVGASVAGSVLTGQVPATSSRGGAGPGGSGPAGGLGGGGSCLIPGYPSPPGGVANLGLPWCPASVSLQVRAFALQAAGAQCAAGSPSAPEQTQALSREIAAACGRLAALGVSNCRCPAGFGGLEYSEDFSSTEGERERQEKRAQQQEEARQAAQGEQQARQEAETRQDAERRRNEINRRNARILSGNCSCIGIEESGEYTCLDGLVGGNNTSETPLCDIRR